MTCCRPLPEHVFLLRNMPTGLSAAHGWLQEGDLIPLGPAPEDGCLEILHTPGHSPDSISLWDSQVGCRIDSPGKHAVQIVCTAIRCKITTSCRAI